MEINNKSIAYAFIANGVQIFLNDKDYFIASKLICSNCGDSWYMNLTECFLCGTKNPFLYKCSSCGSFQSITKSSGKCNNCQSEDLFMMCPNENCISNKDKKINEEANGFGGVFNKDSGLLIAQQYCLNCGSQKHHYKDYKIFIRSIKTMETSLKELNFYLNDFTKESVLIVKYKPNGSSLQYCLLRYKYIVSSKIKLINLKNSFSELVNELFPVGDGKNH